MSVSMFRTNSPWKYVVVCIVSICIQNASDFISAQFVTLLLESEKNKYWRIEVLKCMHQNQNILTAMIMFSLDLN